MQRSYAVLGATGNTGQSLVEILSRSPKNRINAYCRSESKLERLSPGVTSARNVTVYEGSLADTLLIASCIKDTHAVFLAVAVPGNVPGCSIAQDTARAVVAALQRLRAENPAATMPRLVVLSASPVGKPAPSSFGMKVLCTALSYLYADLTAAEQFLRAQKDWLATTYVKPAGLSVDVQSGHALAAEGHGLLSYIDLAAGMIDIADAEGGTFKGLDVAVVPTSNNVKFPWDTPWQLVKGLVVHFLPWLYPYLP